MQTERDGQIVDWIGRIGAAGAGHVMHRFEMSRSVAYGRLCSLVRDGLLDHHAVLYARPGMYTASPVGLRWRGNQRLGNCSLGPGGFEHAWQVADAAAQLQVALAGWGVLGEREIRAIEADDGRLFASTQLSAMIDRPALHRPDLALVAPSGGVVAVEIELSAKAPGRLATICRGWARARHVEHVYYLAADRPARALARAVRSVEATDRISVIGLDDIKRLTAQVAPRPEPNDA